jgi:hypothetical protein
LKCIGNAGKLLSTLLGAAATTDAAAKSQAPLPSALLSYGAIEALIEALKMSLAAPDATSLQDTPAVLSTRKNIAGAIARLARDPACMARIRELRGIEILTKVSDLVL